MLHFSSHLEATMLSFSLIWFKFANNSWENRYIFPFWGYFSIRGAEICQNIYTWRWLWNFSDPKHKPWFWLVNHKHFSLWRFYKTAKKLYRYNQDLSFELLIRDHEKAPRQLFHMSQCYLCSLNEPRNWF